MLRPAVPLRAIAAVLSLFVLADCSAEIGGNGLDVVRPGDATTDAAASDGSHAMDSTINDEGLADGADVGRADAIVDPDGGANEICGDGLDNNNNAYVDEGCPCTPGDQERCFPGDPRNAGIGICAFGMQTCLGGSEIGTWGRCTGATPPGDETCDRMDNDCNGVVDNGCECTAGSTRNCYDGPAGTRSNGVCHDGTQMCIAGPGGIGARWTTACSGQLLPGAESCDGIDNDCNGTVDEGCACGTGASRACYGGPTGTAGMGICHGGMQSCSVVMGMSEWGACAGQQTPQSEICDGIDNDCNGMVDEGCRCYVGDRRICYSGMASTRSVGLCHDGTQTCTVGAGGIGSDWAACAGEALPASELCDGLDNDCDGMIDEGCGCSSGTSRACYNGPAGTQGVGLCRGGLQSCSVTGGVATWGTCAGQIVPVAEICGNGIDDDCNGVVDESCACPIGSSRLCYGGTVETSGVGPCRGGMQMCVLVGTTASWGICAGQVVPASAEICGNVIDDNCNGMTDEGCTCSAGATRSCYDGPIGTNGVGICTGGSQTCSISGGVASWGACGGEVTPATERCDGIDNNCNNAIDEGCLCRTGDMQGCYDGPVGTQGVGICRGGSQSCTVSGGTAAWATCAGQTVPATEICDGIDNNCNGGIDEGCMCRMGDARVCYDGAPGTAGVGLCHGGTQACVVSGGTAAWASCTGQVIPGTEACDGLDNDCDGTVDEGCGCVAGMSRICYDGPSGTNGVGVCHGGAQTCASVGGATSWGTCVSEVTPVTESCDGMDNNCNGVVDEGCACVGGAMRSCYGGPAGTARVGVCRDGSQTCLVSGGIASWSTCSGEQRPLAETCDGIDNDCDAITDEGCVCTPSSSADCYTGPAGTAGVGICRRGTNVCNASGSGYGACSGQVSPGTEVCNGADDNCNGVIDEGCACTAGSSQTCYDGPAGTAGVGRCRQGSQTCAAGGSGTAWGACSGEIVPTTSEACGNGIDDNCNGAVDEGCVCTPGASASCYGGPAGTAGVGVCRAGTQTCNAMGTGFGACSGAVVPGAEVCNGVDDNCDGQIDETCSCVGGNVRSCYTGPTGTSGVGSCRSGTQTCVVGGGVASWGSCTGEINPAPAEACINGVDDNCNGVIDEGCVCAPNTTTACYTGPAGTQGIGICRAGARTCNGGGTAYGACTGQATPAAAETCGNGLDDNCNGAVDEGCVCTAGSTTTCYSGPAGTAGVGSCRSGSHVCNSGGTGYGPCTGEVDPGAEVCGDGIDQDCNGSDFPCGPSVVCPADQTVPAGATATLTGSGSGGTAPLTYNWVVTAGPMPFTLSGATSPTATLRSDIVGVYTVRFTVTDGMGRTASCTTRVTMQPHGLRIELRWDTAGDMDLHLINPVATAWFTSPNDCYFGNRNPDWNTLGFIADNPDLDTDNTTSLGPENIRVDQPVVGQTYTIGVHYWAPNGGPGTIPNHVRIYCGDTTIMPVATYDRSISGVSGGSSSSNDFWRVATVRFTSASACTVTTLGTVATSTAVRAGR